MARDAILAIDQGTSGTRATVMAPGEGGRVLATADAAHTQHVPRDGWVEHDAGEILACTRRVVGTVVGAVGAGRIAGVALANQGETCLVWNRATGTPLARAIVWQDARTQPWMDTLAADPRVRSLI